MTHKKKKIQRNFCPVNGCNCPYFDVNNICLLDNPRENCDDFAAMVECLEDESNTIYIFGSIN